MLPNNATSKKNQTDVWRRGRRRSSLIFRSVARSMSDLFIAARYRAGMVYGCSLSALRFARSAHDWRWRYVTLGRVPRSSSNFVPRDERDRRETSLSGLFKSPNTKADVGQDCTQAGLISPSFNSRFSAFACSLPALIRCTQNVHFSTTPTSRTDTSGFRGSSNGRSQTGFPKLKKRTLKGQAFAQ